MQDSDLLTVIPSPKRRGSNFSNYFTRKTTAEKDFKRLTPHIHDYDILKRSGGVDEISYMFLARHTISGKTVSLKLTDLTLSQDYEFIEEVIRTIENNKLLRHHNILPNLLSFLEGDEMWSVTLPQTGTLKEILKNHFPEGFGEIAVATILREVLKGLQYIHENNMIHNDIRADNILIDQRGDIRIGGFRQMSIMQNFGNLKHTAFSLVGDNIEWSAPEVMTQNSNFGVSADVYSLGITALELAYNKTPFDNWPPLKVLLCKQQFPCPAIKSDKIMSKSFHKFIFACLQKNPNNRPTVNELLEYNFIKQAKNNLYLENLILKLVNDHSESSTPSSSPSRSNTQQSRPGTAESFGQFSPGSGSNTTSTAATSPLEFFFDLSN